MSPMEKTKNLERQFIDIDLLDPNPDNPNEMSDAEFNMLADNIEKIGFVDPVFVRPKPNGRFKIIGGHHRWDVAKVFGFSQVPCTIITDPDFDDDQEKFQNVRMNVIRGRLSPDKFIKMYESLQSKYADAIMAEAFGFAEEEEFRKLVKQVSKTLPADMQKDFEKASAEIKTINGLSNLLNSLFTKYGDTLPHGYMCFDFGGKESVWLRMTTDTYKSMLIVGKMCVVEKRTMDDIVGGLIRMAANGELSSQLVQLIAKSKEVNIPDTVVMPTEEVLA